MTIFIVVSVIYPNGLDIRPKQLGHSNIALILVDLLYKIDTPTNVLPSIHIFNLLVCAWLLVNQSMQRVL